MPASGGRPTLLFTHGGGLCKEAWEPVIRCLHESPLLKRSPTATQAIDFPYHGSKRDNSVKPRVFTAGPRSRRAEVADFVREFKKQHPQTPLIGIGHSMGAVALWLAEINNPGTFDGLILFEPMYNLTKPENSYLIDMLVAATLRRETQWPSREVALTHLTQFKNFATWDRESLDAYLRGALVEAQDGSITLACDPQIEAATHCGYPFWISAEESARPKCRVSFHGGDVSRFFAVDHFEEMRAQSPHIYKIGSVMPKCSHVMVMENPALSAEKILEDLAELPVRRGDNKYPASALQTRITDNGKECVSSDTGTLQSLVGDATDHLTQASGGCFGNICLAPNSKAQVADILERLAAFEAEPFVQRCMCDVPAGEVVLAVATLRDRQEAATSARPTPRRPQSHRLFFA